MERAGKTKRTLVIGLGNSLIGDDAFGSRVVERLRSGTPDALPHAELVEAHTDLLELIDRFPAYERVVLVDAVLDPSGKLGSPGRVVLADEESMAAWSEASPSAHQFSPLLAVRLFRSLNPSATTRIFLVGLCVDRLAFPSEVNSGCCVLNEEAVISGAAMVCELV
jgi:hydrogenase maturation protease